MSARERRAMREQLRQARMARETAEAARADETRQAVSVLWERAGAVHGDHPYVVARGIRPYGAKQLRSVLMVPLVDMHGVLHSAQFIAPDATKRFRAGGRVAGCFCRTGDAPQGNATLLVCEGWATACSLHEATGFTVFAAMSAGNLMAVASAVRSKYPPVRLILCADDDHATEGNPGLTLARRAAQATGALVAVPDFSGASGDDPRLGTDFNDLHAIACLDAVRRCVEAATPPPPDTGPVFPALDARPCWCNYPEPFTSGGKPVRAGVWLHGVRYRRHDGPELIDRWLCSPLEVVAVTRNAEDAEYGRLLDIRSPAGQHKRWAMPMSMLAGGGDEVLATLLSDGVTLDLGQKADVLRYLASTTPAVMMRCATTTGWHDGAFVLPGCVLGPGAADIWFQTSTRAAPYAQAGDLPGWQTMAALARGNPLLMLAISSALAGPLLDPLNIDGAGLHYFGDSSSGKTTALMAAVSVWGGARFKRTWRATANGLEGAAVLHSDTLLALDEIGEIDPRALYEAVYALGNGTGKTRSNRYGEARAPARWRICLLSTGETTIAARMASAGIEARAGQELRVLDVSVAGTHGLLEDLHGRPGSAQLADDIRHLAAHHYGHAGPAFVTRLLDVLAGDADDTPLSGILSGVLAAFDASGGQELRAARMFALCAMAGEWSSQWGITPWREGEALDAARHAFGLWRSRRAVAGLPSEDATILQKLTDAIDRHGDSRFSDVQDASPPMIHQRLGWRRRSGERLLYLFTADGLREVTKGHDFSRVLLALERARALVARDSANGVRSKTTRTPDGRSPRLYHVDPERLCPAGTAGGTAP